MSQMAFHILFVGLCIFCALGFGLWWLSQYRDNRGLLQLAAATPSILGGACLVYYGIPFADKMKGERFQ